MIKSIVFTLTLLSISPLVIQAQSNDLYIVFNEASWCKYCKANGERIHQLVDEYALKNNVLVISNDVTNEETKKNAVPQLTELGLYDFMQFRKEAAIVFVFDASSNSLLDKFSIKLDNEKILTILNQSLAKVSQ